MVLELSREQAIFMYFIECCDLDLWPPKSNWIILPSCYILGPNYIKIRSAILRYCENEPKLDMYNAVWPLTFDLYNLITLLVSYCSYTTKVTSKCDQPFWSYCGNEPKLDMYKASWPLTFDLWTPKSNQVIGALLYILHPSYIKIRPAILTLVR